MKDDLSRYSQSTSTSLTEQRRRLFEEQEQLNRDWVSADRRLVRKK